MFKDKTHAEKIAIIVMWVQMIFLIIGIVAGIFGIFAAMAYIEGRNQ